MKDKSWQIQTVHRTTKWDGLYHWHRLYEQELYNYWDWTTIQWERGRGNDHKAWAKNAI